MPISFLKRLNLSKRFEIFLPLHWRSAPVLAGTHDVGVYGEWVAQSFLKSQGYKILVQNYTASWGKDPSEAGEIDITCRHENTLVFVEVKTRTGTLFERPALSVDATKQRKLIRTAHEYLKELRLGEEIATRFDIVEIHLAPHQKPVCTILPAAFGINKRV